MLQIRQGNSKLSFNYATKVASPIGNGTLVPQIRYFAIQCLIIGFRMEVS